MCKLVREDTSSSKLLPVPGIHEPCRVCSDVQTCQILVGARCALLCHGVSERIGVNHPVGLALSAPFSNCLVETSSVNLKNQELDL